MTSDWLEAYGRSVVKYRGQLSLLILLITILSLWGITNRLKQGTPFDFTPQAMFMGEGGEWERLQGYEAEFGAEDNTIIAMVEGPIESTDGLALMAALHDAAEAVSGVTSVDSIINATIAQRDELGMIVVDDAIGEDADLRLAKSDPFLSPVLVAKDGTAATLQIHLDNQLQQISDLSPVVFEVTDRLRAIPRPDGFTLHVTGVPFVRAEVVELMIEDEKVFFPLVAVMFLPTIVILFRRFWLGVSPLIGVLIATIWTMGILFSQGAVLNILSALTPTLVLVIGVADGIHLVSRYREELSKDNNPEQAMGRTTRQMALACFLTTFTTAAGFASLFVADTQVIRDFGMHVAIGVMITFFAVMLVVPTLLAWIPVDRVGLPSKVVERPVYTRLAQFVIDKPARVLMTCLALTVFVTWLGRDVQTNSSILEMYQPEHPTWEAVHTAQEKVGGIIPVFIHLNGQPDQMLEPDILQRVDALEQELRAMDLATFTVSPAGWVQHLHGLLTDETVWPESRAAVSQELLVAEMTGDLPIERVLSDDRGRGRIVAITKDAGGREFLKAKNALEKSAETIFEGTGITIDVTGDGMLASTGVDRLITDLLTSLLLILGVILLTMLVLLRDLKLTLIATLPNLVPLMFILGTLGLLGTDLQTSNIVSFTIAVGLAVDDTIHFIVRYREERRRCSDTATAIHKTFQGAGHAIVLTSILLVFGFGVLALSSLTTTHFFGLLACITMAAALFGDLLILPALLQLFDKQETA